MEQGDTEIFLSTPSARRATIAAVLDDNALKISIHAPRVAGDPLKHRKKRA